MKRFLFTMCIALLGLQFNAQTVTDIVVTSPVHNTLEAAVIAAGLDDDLAGAGPFTLFAPTDAAFDALPAGTTVDAGSTGFIVFASSWNPGEERPVKCYFNSSAPIPDGYLMHFTMSVTNLAQIGRAHV